MAETDNKDSKEDIFEPYRNAEIRHSDDAIG